MSPMPDVATIAGAYRVRLHGHRFRGPLGAHASRGAGGSLEFFDFRDYVPGDDVRRVDWHGFARSGQLRVRQFEADVAPHWDVVVDTSASMAVSATKALALRELVAAFVHWGRREGGVPRVCALGGGVLDPASLPLGDGPREPLLPLLPLRSGGVRVLIADALWPESATAVVHGLRAAAAHFLHVQLLDPWEASPPVGELLTLVDCETGARHDHLLDAATVAAYRDRLQRLCDDVRATVLASGGSHVTVVAADLATMCAETLLPGGVLEPA
jgi:uncharacterized protein (DUF58 family)